MATCKIEIYTDIFKNSVADLILNIQNEGFRNTDNLTIGTRL